MARKSLDALPETFVSTTEVTKLASKALRAGKLRKLASRLYTKDLTGDPHAIVRRNLWQIVAGYFPGALIADRTALEGGPAKDGSVFLVSAESGSVVALPGFILRPRRGAKPQSSDLPFMGGLRMSSPARALLDNSVASRSRGAVARTLSRPEMETHLEGVLRRGGEGELNRLRDEARTLSRRIGRVREFAALDKMIGALLNTRAGALSTPAARARRRGLPFDPAGADLFETLRAELHREAPHTRLAPVHKAPALPFFEAYFSNFIEGTEFAVDEAAAIVFENRIPAARPQDAHDVLGTYRIVADAREMRQAPATFADFERLLQRRHAAVMHARADKMPGRYKVEPNRAGATFVAPDLVRGTLAEGFKAYRALNAPFQRAVLMMFLIAEVHPFADGNGRLARIMMNAELVAAGETRILMPTVYRANYLSAMKAVTNRAGVEPLVRVLDFAQRFTHAVDWSTVDRARADLQAANAFLDSAEAEDKGLRLRVPR